MIYNACVGSAGLLSLGVGALFEFLPPHSSTFPFPWLPVAIFTVLANVCYTLGPIADLTLRRPLGDRAPAVGPALFRYGFVFSIGLALIPIPVIVLEWLARALL